MKSDIKNKSDIIKLVNMFYEQVKSDKILGPVFNEVHHIDWDKHLPRMYSFWENILFFTGSYDGNPMNIHRAIHEKNHLTKAQFNQWNKLFNKTVQELFEGPNAQMIQLKAKNISTVMQIKILDQ